MIEEAIKLAKRSTIKRHKTGAIIVDSSNDIVAKGWSHESSLKLKRFRSIHAEVHCILRSNRQRLAGSTIYIATIAAKSGNTTLSKPCEGCQGILAEVGIHRIFYTDRKGTRRLLL